MITQKIKRPLFALLVLVLLAASGVSACSANPGAAESTGDLPMAPMSGMPAEVQSAPVNVQEAYQFAAANPDVMTHIPCYCGCGAMGHTSNYSCYVQDVDDQGVIKYDTHALGCSICVDITLDTMRLLQQGKTVAEIKTIVDQTYSQYGPTNMP